MCELGVSPQTHDKLEEVASMFFVGYWCHSFCTLSSDMLWNGSEKSELVVYFILVTWEAGSSSTSSPQSCKREIRSVWRTLGDVSLQRCLCDIFGKYCLHNKACEIGATVERGQEWDRDVKLLRLEQKKETRVYSWVTALVVWHFFTQSGSCLLWFMRDFSLLSNMVEFRDLIQPYDLFNSLWEGYFYGCRENSLFFIINKFIKI